jgi:chromosome segregation ATPase
MFATRKLGHNKQQAAIKVLEQDLARKDTLITQWKERYSEQSERLEQLQETNTSLEERLVHATEIIENKNTFIQHLSSEVQRLDQNLLLLQKKYIEKVHLMNTEITACEEHIEKMKTHQHAQEEQITSLGMRISKLTQTNDERMRQLKLLQQDLFTAQTTLATKELELENAKYLVRDYKAIFGEGKPHENVHTQTESID